MKSKKCSWEDCNELAVVTYDGRDFCEKHGEEHLIAKGFEEL